MTAPYQLDPEITSTGLDTVVPWVDFRRGLCAVVAHADPDPEAGVNKVRIDCSPSGATLITATNRFTAALARIDAVNPAPTRCAVSLHIDEVRKILAVFSEVKDDAGEHLLRCQAVGEQFEVQDVSGIIDGERLTVNLMPPDARFPNIPRMFARWTHMDPAHATTPAFNWDFLKLFQSAVKCYGKAPMRLSMTGLSSALVLVGDQFVGAVAGVKLHDETVETLTAWQNKLFTELPPLSTFIDEPDPVDISSWIETPEQDAADTEMLRRAAQIVVQTQFVSPAMLQRKLKVGAARALRILQDLNAAEITANIDDATWKVLISPDRLDEALAALDTPDTTDSEDTP